MTINVLGIETSCDETGIAIYNLKRGLVAHTLYSQAEDHAQYGGVVPELASRDHIRKTIPLIDQVIKQAQMTRDDVGAIAYTSGPGLIGALLVGATIGRTLAWAWKKPAIEVHHMEAHLLAPMLGDNAPDYPFIALLISGGHTQLIAVNKPGQYQILGDTLDDAAGEAFDKTAKLLELGYPGGPALASLAEKGIPGIYKFPRPMTDRPGLDFSFSGLKTFTLNTYQASDKTAQDKANIAFAFQQAVADTLVIKCRRAIQSTGIKRLVIAGGVSANLEIRQKLQAMIQKEAAELCFPPHQFCTDNGAMVALAGALRLTTSTTNAAPPEISVKPRYPLTDLTAFENVN